MSTFVLSGTTSIELVRVVYGHSDPILKQDFLTRKLCTLASTTSCIVMNRGSLNSNLISIEMIC